MRYLFILYILMVLQAAPVLAEESRNGLNYTTRGGQASRDGALHYRALRYDEEKPEEEEEKKLAAEEEEADRVWQKYKALAAGTYVDEPDPKETKGKQDSGDQDSEDKETGAKTTQPAPVTGFTAILEEYRKNKVQRSQMRTITIRQPEAASPSGDKTAEPAASGQP